MNEPAPCPACGAPVPSRERPHGGRRARYCSAACKARAYRDRQQTGQLPASGAPPLTAAARHARAVEIRQQVSELTGTLADTASGQQALFTTPGGVRRARPAQAARTLHRLISELAALAAAATITERATKRRPTAIGLQDSLLSDDASSFSEA